MLSAWNNRQEYHSVHNCPRHPWIEPGSLDLEDSHRQPALWREGFNTGFCVSSSRIFQKIRVMAADFQPPN